MIYLWLLLPWTISGVVSLVYWFTLDHDLLAVDLFCMTFVSIFVGPIAFLIGWCIHTRKSPLELVLIKNRNRHE